MQKKKNNNNNIYIFNFTQKFTVSSNINFEMILCIHRIKYVNFIRYQEFHLRQREN